MKTLLVKEVAEYLGLTVPRVHVLIKSRKLKVERRGRDIFVNAADLKLLEVRRVGRPRKDGTPTGSKPKPATKSKPATAPKAKPAPRTRVR
jgi:excisionase family DNA binding protein